jgi:hypothetical protein
LRALSAGLASRPCLRGNPPRWQRRCCSGLSWRRWYCAHAAAMPARKTAGRAKRQNRARVCSLSQNHVGRRYCVAWLLVACAGRLPLHPSTTPEKAPGVLHERTRAGKARASFSSARPTGGVQNQNQTRCLRARPHTSRHIAPGRKTKAARHVRAARWGLLGRWGSLR